MSDTANMATAKLRPLISDFTYGELSPKLQGRSDSPVYKKGAALIKNFSPMLQGGFRRRAGTLQVSTLTNNPISASIRLYGMIVSGSLWYLLEFTPLLLRVWKNGSTLLATTYVTPYIAGDLPSMQFGWAYPDLFIASQGHPPAMFAYTGSDTFSFIQPIPLVGSAAQYYSGTTTATSNTITGVSPDPTASLATLIGKPISGPGIPPGTTVSNVTTNTIVMSAVATASATVTVAISQDDSLPFQGLGNYPAAVSFANQRVFWFSSVNEPQNMWTSVAGIFDQYGNMELQFFELVDYDVQEMSTNALGQPLDSTGAIVTPSAGNTPAYNTIVQKQEIIGDADGFAAAIYSDKNDSIQWGISSSDVLIGTLSAIYMIPGDATANTFSIVPVTKMGCAPVQAVLIPNGILFIDRPGKQVIVFNWQRVYYITPPPESFSLFSDHLFMTNTIVAFVHQQSPIARFWFLRTDGTLVACEYDATYDVRAFWEFVTDGTILSIAVGQGTQEDVLYMAVQRGSNVVIEYLSTMDWASASSKVGSVLPAVFADCAVVQYNATAFSVVTGIDNLDGKTVDLVGDGAYLGTAVVASGSVTLPADANGKATYNTAVVGLHYDATLRTMGIDVGNVENSYEIKEIGIPRVGIIFYQTLAAQLRSIQGNVQPCDLSNSPGRPLNPLASFPTPYSGPQRVPFMGGYQYGSYVQVESILPLPCTVSAIIPEITAEP